MFKKKTSKSTEIIILIILLCIFVACFYSLLWATSWSLPRRVCTSCLAGAGHDDSGRGNHSTFNGCKYSSDGPFSDGSVTFNGANDYVNCGRDTSLDVGPTATLEAWINMADASRQFESIIHRGNYETS